jgi:hypothetical protein
VTTSLNGWPVIPQYGDPRLVTLDVPGVKRRLTLARDAAPLLVALAHDYHRWVAPLDVGPWDEGGYNNRDANGAPGRKSNHASASAMDLNWSAEGAQGSARGKAFFATAKARLGVARIKAIYGDVVTWGGDWRAQDFMHFEIKAGVTPKQVAAKIKKLGITPEGVRTRNRFGRPIKPRQ